jgi:hypothetical protein
LWGIVPSSFGGGSNESGGLVRSEGQIAELERAFGELFYGCINQIQTDDASVKPSVNVQEPLAMETVEATRAEV